MCSKFGAFQKLQGNQKMLSHHCHHTQCSGGSVINFYFNWCLGFKFRKLKQSIKSLDKCGVVAVAVVTCSVISQASQSFILRD